MEEDSNVMDTTKVQRLQLQQRLYKLEQTLETLEYELHGKFVEKFVAAILSEYKDLITHQCREISNKLGLHYMDSDDVAQESIEYLIRWCLPASLKRSSKNKIWLPYLKRSLHNCFINLWKQSNTASRKMDFVYIDDGAKGAAVLRKYGIDNAIDLTDELRYRELISLVAGDLKPKTKKIFLGILNPSKEIIDFVYEMKKSGENRNSSKRHLAAYYKVSLVEFNKYLKEIRRSIEENANKV
jgi:hypothetical protein